MQPGFQTETSSKMQLIAPVDTIFFTTQQQMKLAKENEDHSKVIQGLLQNKILLPKQSQGQMQMLKQK